MQVIDPLPDLFFRFPQSRFKRRFSDFDRATDDAGHLYLELLA